MGDFMKKDYISVDMKSLVTHLTFSQNMLPFTFIALDNNIICVLAVTHASFEIGYRFEADIYKIYKYINDGTK